MIKIYNFVRFRFIFITLSIATISGLLISTLFQGGFNMGVDFQAGISLRVAVPTEKAKAPIETVRQSLAGLDGVQIQLLGNTSKQEYLIKVKQSSEDKAFSKEISAKVVGLLEKPFGAGNVILQQSDYVGPRFSTDLASQTAFLTIIALGLILLYTWYRFRLGYAVAAILATLHDTFFMLGVIGAFQLEVNTTTVAAVLTIIGYSINDTIVVFDRIRENEKVMRESKLSAIINSSISQTLSRTLITGVTTLLVLIALFLLTSGDVHDFAINMLVGILVGTYSSIFIASPVLLGWTNVADGMKKRQELKKYGSSAPAKQDQEAPAADEAPEAEDDGAAAEASDDLLQSNVQVRHKIKLSREKRKRQSGR